MKKNVVLVALATFAMLVMGLSEANAQKVTWNVKGGLGFSSVSLSGMDGSPEQKFVGKIGVGAEIPFAPNWSIMPSFEYAFKGTGWEATSEYDYDKEDLSLNYLQIPLVAAYRLNLSKDWNLTLKAGPYFAFGISGSLKGDYTYDGRTEHEEIDDIFGGDSPVQRFDCGVDVGVDFEYHRFVVGFEYERGLTNSSKRSRYTMNTQAFYATLGYKF